MKWIYILKCDDNVYYVGQTSRLYRRFWEHSDKRGGKNTKIHNPEKIVAIYKVSNIINFIHYNEQIIDINKNGELKFWIESPTYIFNIWDDNNDDSKYAYVCENNIVECMMMHNVDNWKNIRGGKYVRFDCNYEFPNNENIKEIPLCRCGLPCDIKKDKNNNMLFFRCAKKNMWNKFKIEFGIKDEPCNFYREYVTDIELRILSRKKDNERRETLRKLFVKSSWLENIPNKTETNETCVSCTRNVWNVRQGITYLDCKKLICFDCFIYKNEELKNKYSLFNKRKCLISL